MSESDADANLKELVLERHAEIKKMGRKGVVIGSVLIGGACLFFYWGQGLAQGHVLTLHWGKVYGVVGLVGCYGFWRLINGIIRLVRPEFERGSIPDMAD